MTPLKWSREYFFYWYNDDAIMCVHYLVEWLAVCTANVKCIRSVFSILSHSAKKG